jgi:hypothetical protein
MAQNCNWFKNAEYETVEYETVDQTRNPATESTYTRNPATVSTYTSGTTIIGRITEYETADQIRKPATETTWINGTRDETRVQTRKLWQQLMVRVCKLRKLTNWYRDLPVDRQVFTKSIARCRKPQPFI